MQVIFFFFRQKYFLNVFFLFIILLLLININLVFSSQSNAQVSSPLSVKVVGNHMVNGAGQQIRIIGVNNIHNPCLQDARGEAGIFDFPSTTQAAAGMAKWHINGVRVLVNEDRWLGLNNFTSDSGTTYQQAIINYVKLLHSYGMYVIVDLHCNAPGTNLSTSQQAMADADHAIAYWQSVANTFKNDPAVIFDAYNEPHIDATNAQTASPWQCWRDGCEITQLVQNRQSNTQTSWQGLGMQGIINAIRSTGATNPIMLGGLNFSQDLRQFLQYLPNDPQHQLIASYHDYMGPTSRNTQTYWDTVIAPIAQQMPVITSEFGEKDMQSTYVVPFMEWADAHGVSYTAFVWGDWNGGYALLSNWDGTPSTYGQAMYSHFLSINPVGSTLQSSPSSANITPESSDQSAQTTPPPPAGCYYQMQKSAGFIDRIRLFFTNVLCHIGFHALCQQPVLICSNTPASMLTPTPTHIQSSQQTTSEQTCRAIGGNCSRFFINGRGCAPGRHITTEGVCQPSFHCCISDNQQ